MLFWFVYPSPFLSAEYRHLTGRHSGHEVDPCVPQRKSSTTRFGGNDHWARLRSKSHPVWAVGGVRRQDVRCGKLPKKNRHEHLMERIIGYHWFEGWNLWHFGSSSSSRHSIVRGSAVARAQQNLLFDILPISPLKFGQTSLVVAIAHGNQLWSSQLRPWIFWGSTNPT